MNIENHVIQPAIVGRSVDLTPPTTMVAAFIGGAIAGIPGALVATPFVGAAKAIYLEARGRAKPRAGVRPRLLGRLRGRLAPQTRDRRSAGDGARYTATPAAQIAQSVEQRTRNA